MGSLPILMTSSVSTRGMKGAAFSDAEREQMYLGALSYYLSTLEPARRIVFAENSGWDLVGMRNSLYERFGRAVDRVEWISVDPSGCDISRGKGYNEILLMNEAIRRSVAICEADAFMKVTGRYPIYNLLRYIGEAEKFISEGGCYYGDIKDHKVFDWLFPNNTKKWNGHAAYTVLFATTVSFYLEKLEHSYVECNDYTDDWIENVWFRILKPYRDQRDCRVQLRFPVEPVCGGLQGSTAQTIAFSQSNESMKALVARLVGNGIRIFLPWFWF